MTATPACKEEVAMAEEVAVAEKAAVVEVVAIAVGFRMEAHPPGNVRRPVVETRQEEVMIPTVCLTAEVLVERQLVWAKLLG